MDKQYEWEKINRLGNGVKVFFVMLVVVLLSVFLASSALAAPGGDNIIITEVEFDPSAAENEAEWFELFNPTTAPIDIGGWSIAEGSGPPPQSYTFPPSTIIPSGGYLLVVNDTAGFNVEHSGIVPDLDMEGPNCYGAGPTYPECLRLNNSGTDELTLRDGPVLTGTTIDYVSWGSGAYADANNGESICRSTSDDTDTATDWLDSCTPSPKAGTYALSNDLPVFTPVAQTVPENSAVSYDVSADASDPNAGQTLTYAIAGSGADDALFSIDATTGVVTMQITPNYEAPQDADGDNVYAVDIRVSDDGTPMLATTATLLITITDINTAPTDIALTKTTLPENSASGSIIGTLSSSDDGENDPPVQIYTLGCSAPDNGFFTISGTQLTSAISFDFEAPQDANGDNLYEICVRVSDGTLTYDKTFSISIDDVDEPIVAPPVLTAPQNIKISCRDHDIKITWDNSNDDVDGFIILRKKNHASYKERKVLVGADGTSYKDKKVDAGDAYKYKVRAYRNLDTGTLYSPYATSKTCEMDEDTPEEEEVIASSTVLAPPPSASRPKGPSVSFTTIPTPSEEESPAPQERAGEQSATEQKAQPVANENYSKHEQRTQTAHTDIAHMAQKITTASIATATTAFVIALFSQPLSPSNPLVRLLSLFGFLFYRKRTTWGTVYDRETRCAIVGARVLLLNDDGIIVDRVMTGAYGTYGFLADQGRYRLRVEKKNYKQVLRDTKDVLYGDVYTGETFHVKKDDVISINIALAPQVTTHKKQFTKSFMRYMGDVLMKSSFFIMLLGFFSSLVMFFLRHTVINGIIILLYGVIFLVTYYLFTKRPGIVRYGTTGKPAPFALISLYTPETPTKREYFAVSDELGRYMLFVKNGTYIMKVSSHGSLDTALTATKTIHVHRGMVQENIDLY